MADELVEITQEALDDAIDVIENWAENRKNPAAKAAAKYMAGMIRDISGIPDDIGGDED